MQVRLSNRFQHVAIGACAAVVAVSMASAIPSEARAVDTYDASFELAAPTDSDHDRVSDAPDTVSALAGAQETGTPVEDLSQRTESMTVVANPDGTFTSSSAGVPVRIKRGDEWVPVDYDLAQRDDGSYSPRASPVDVSIDGGSAKEAARVTLDDGGSLAFTWPTNLPTPTVNGGVATYRVSSTTDLVVAVTSAGVNARIRLNSKPAADDPVFKLGLRADDLDVDQTASGDLQITDEDGTTVGTTTQLVAWDSQTDAAGDPKNIVALDADLSTTKVDGDVTQHRLDLSAPDGFLSDPTTKYPVIIDPDISMGKTRDTWVRNADSNNYSSDYRLIVGKINGSSNTNPARAYLKFFTSTLEKNPNIDIVSGQLGLWQYYAYTCDPRQMNIHPVNVDWSENMTWANKPDAVTGTNATALMTAQRGASACPERGWNTVDVTNMVKRWQDGSTDMQGLRLAAEDETKSAFERRFCSMNVDTSTSCTAAMVPYLNVTYRSKVATVTLPAGGQTQVLVPDPAGSPKDDGTARTTELSVQATNWSAAGGVSVFDAEGAEPVSPTVSFGSANNSAVGVGTTLRVAVSSDGEVTVHNTSPGSVTVNLWQGNWMDGSTQAADPNVLGPQPLPEVIETPSTSVPMTTTVTPPISQNYVLTQNSPSKVTASIGGQVVGTYTPAAFDESGNPVASSISVNGNKLVVTTQPGATSAVTVVTPFDASDPANPAVQALYPPSATMSTTEDPITAAEVVDVVDSAPQTLIEDSTTSSTVSASMYSNSTMSTASLRSSKVKVPHEYESTYSVNPAKFYYYDPELSYPRRTPWTHDQHDYCSKSPNGVSIWQGATAVSFRGPCARHDLCIDFKQADDRKYCDTQFKADLRQNCRYYLTKRLGANNPYLKGGLRNCYFKTGVYYGAVSNATKNKTDKGHWGNGEVITPTSLTYPTQRYDVWK